MNLEISYKPLWKTYLTDFCSEDGECDLADVIALVPMMKNGKDVIPLVFAL